MIKLHLPMPPSTNALFTNVPKRGRVPTKRYTEWRIAAGLSLNVQRPGRLSGPVAIEYAVGTDTRCDLGNTEKALSDLLVSSNTIDGDCRKTVKKITLYWADIKGVNVTIRGDDGQ